MKKIAVLLAAYNGENYIREQLESLHNQTFQDFVCYIHDDGSRDGTMDILKEYENMYPEQFVIMDGTATGSSKANFMFMLDKVIGQYGYYMFCDQDDVWIPEKIEMLYSRILQEPEEVPCVVYSDMKVVDESLHMIADSFADYTHIIPEEAVFPNTALRGYAAGCSMLFNVSLARLIVVKDTTKLLMHDWWVMLVASLMGKICYIEQPLVLYRQHSNNIMGAKKRTKYTVWGERLIRLLTFRQFQITRMGLYDYIYQIGELSHIPEVYEKHYDLVNGAVYIHKMSKKKRCEYILKYGIYQNSYSKYWSCVCV